VYQPNQLLVAKESSLCQFTIAANSTIYIFGGEPFAEERFIDWNFVSTSKERIEEAKQKWKAQKFPKITGDETEYIPYPSRNKKNES
jgi:redox-sensitive bicupin YhaK (pirin superfamily)